MTHTVLIDLDDTLLINPMDRFLPAYFQRLGDYLSDLVPPDRMLAALMTGTRAMLKNDDPTTRLERKFADIYYPELELDEIELRERIHNFYTQIFPQLEPLTQVNPGAREFVAHLFANGYEVVIATNPLFPMSAIEARLRWARLPVDEFDFSIVTSYENFHFTKPNPAYFTEILGLLGRPLTEAVMIGNDTAADLDPASLLEMPVFHLHGQAVDRYPGGNFNEAEKWLSGVWDQLEPVSKLKPEITFARFKGYLAALLTMADHCDESTWKARPQPDEWAPIEIIAHLADVENEVNIPRLEQFDQEAEPHLAAFDTDIWAQERGYIDYDPRSTLNDFTSARANLIARLTNLDTDDWQQEGSHSLLGPTTLAEVMHFAAEHDLLHLDQMRKTIGYPP
jgi:FMN phosphatase YigB (HAD superfamily)